MLLPLSSSAPASSSSMSACWGIIEGTGNLRQVDDAVPVVVVLTVVVLSVAEQATVVEHFVVVDVAVTEDSSAL